MSDVTTATGDDVELVVAIAAAAFFDDPIMTWAFEDADQRRPYLEKLLRAVADGYLPEGGVVHLCQTSTVALWRSPSYEHHRPIATAVEDRAVALSDFPEESARRLGLLGSLMAAAHPHTPHWYLHVLGTVPERQGQGLGQRTLRPVLEVCDGEGIPAYLESSNAVNIPFYRRQGFQPRGEIAVPEGPSLYPMWREPR